MFLFYRETHRLSDLPGGELARALAESSEQPRSTRPVDYVLNPVGSIMVNISNPDLSRYLVRLVDAAGLLRLVSLKRMIRAAGVDIEAVEAFLASQPDALRSPYEDGPMKWDPHRQVIYFDGLSDSRHLQELSLVFL